MDLPVLILCARLNLPCPVDPKPTNLNSQIQIAWNYLILNELDKCSKTVSLINHNEFM